MKKWAKRISLVFLGLILIVAGFLGFSHVKTESLRSQKITIEKIDFPIPSDSASIQRGERLVKVRGCMDCHGSDLGGKTFIQDPPLGIFSGGNLTRGRGSNVLNYQDQDWIRAIRYGVSAAHLPLIFMPAPDYFGMTNEDLGQMIAYLKQIPAVDRENPEIQIGPAGRAMYVLGKLPILFSYQMIDRTLAHEEKIVAEPTARYGKYLAQSCTGCHRADLTGGKIQGVPPNWPAASNLSKAGRVQSWTFEQFKTVLTEGKTPDGHQIDPQFMPWQSTQSMNETEFKALYEYVRSLPPK